MVEIEVAEDYRRCQCCYGKGNVKEIAFRSERQGVVIAVCSDCISELLRKLDAKPVVHGEWIRKKHFKTLPDMGMTISGEYPTCSICGFAEMGLAQETNYCPNCGANMG